MFIVTAFLVVTFICGHLIAILLNNFYSNQKEPLTIYERIEARIKNIINRDNRSLDSLVYIGTKKNQLWVGATSTEEKYNVHLVKFVFDNSYNETEIFDHIEENGLNKIKYTQEIKEGDPSRGSDLVPSELVGTTHTTKNKTSFIESGGNLIRFECGTTEEGVYSFVFDETKAQTVNYNFYSGKNASIITPIWEN